MTKCYPNIVRAIYNEWTQVIPVPSCHLPKFGFVGAVLPGVMEVARGGDTLPKFQAITYLYIYSLQDSTTHSTE